MAQRIVIRDEAVEAATRVMEKTKLGSLTEVVSVMFSRYSRHLEETWEVLPQQVIPESLPTNPSSDIRTDFNFAEPLTGL